MTDTSRTALLREVAGRIDRLCPGHPVRVAIDGRTASGKTTFADELAAVLAGRERSVIRTSIDGFHRPRAERYARGRHSAEGYYHDARDLPAIVALLLAPLGPKGDRRYRPAYALYESLCQPEARSDAIIDNDDLARPRLVVGASGRLIQSAGDLS